MDSTSISREGHSHVSGDHPPQGFAASDITAQGGSVVHQKPNGVPEVENAILVMGCTGSGKSSFIATMTSASVDVSHNLQCGMTLTPPFGPFSDLSLQVLRCVGDGSILVIPIKPSLWLIHLGLMI